MQDKEVVKTGRGAAISFQDAQDIYNTLTGKVESLSRYVYGYHTVTEDDFDRLHRNIEACIGTFACTSSNLSVVVRYADGSTECHTSVARFKIDVMKSAAVVETVDFEYDFLISLGEQKEVKSYKIVVGVRSTVGSVTRHILTNATDEEKHIFRTFDRATGRYEIRYVDLSLARHFEAQINNWFKSLVIAPESRILSWARRKSEYLSMAARILAVFAIMWISVERFIPQVASNADLFYHGWVAFMIFFSANAVFLRLSSFAETSLKSIHQYSFISMSNADLNARDSLDRSRSKSLLRIFLIWVLPVVLSIIANVASKWMGI